MDIERLQTHAGFLRSVTRALLRDEHRAEDAVQQTWLAAIERGRVTSGATGSIPARGSTRGWLGRVAVNFAKRSVREEARRNAREQVVAERRAASARSSVSPAEWAERRAAARAVVDAVFTLDEPYRTTVLQRFYEGRTPKEIATEHEISVETVKTRLKRAMERLRKRLDAYDENRSSGEEPRGRGSWRAALAPFALGSEGVSATAAASTTTSGASFVGGAAKVVMAGAVAISMLVMLLVVLRRGEGFEATAAVEPRASSSASLFAGADPGFAESAVDDGTTAAAAATPRDESVTLRVRWSDGTPAAGIGVRVSKAMSGRRPAPIVDATELRSASDGRIVLRGLEPGRYRARLDRGRSRTFAVGGARRAEIDLRIAKGLEVEGIVVDARGNPIADASIVMAVTDEPGASIVGRSDGKGRFAIRDAPRRAFLGARSATRAASDLVAVERPGDAPLRLVVGEDPVTISGVVVAADGTPVANAGVVLGSGGVHRARKTTDGRRIASPEPFRGTTDAEGAFRFEGLPPGERSIEVAAVGFGPWRATIGDSSAGASHEVRVVLDAGAFLTGRIVDESGAPVADARVDAAAKDLGRFDSEVRELLTAFSDETGTYRLGPLPAGACRVEARATVGMAERETFVAAGSEGVLDLRLDAGRSLKGVVVRERGERLARAMIAVLGEANGPHRPVVVRASTEEDGSFMLSNLQDHGERFALEVRVPAASPDRGQGPSIVHRVDDVVPGGELRIVVPDSAWPTSRIRGFVVDEARLAAESGTLEAPDFTPVALQVFRPDALEPANFVLDAPGEFEVGPVHSGVCRIRALRRDAGIVDLGRFEIESRDMVDIGSIRFEPSRGVVFDLARADGKEFDVRMMQILDASFDHVSAVIAVDGRMRAEKPLVKGRYYLAPRQHPLASNYVEFTTDPEREAICAALLEPGVRCSVELEWLADPPLPTRIDLRITDSSGLTAQGYSRFVTVRSAANQMMVLRPGIYRAEAQDGKGFRGETVFEVVDGPQPALVRVPMR